MEEGTAKFSMEGPCPHGGKHLIVPREGQKNPIAGTAWRICWNCKSIFMWVVDSNKKSKSEAQPKSKKPEEIS